MVDTERMWQHFDEVQKGIVLYLTYAKPPVSIDTLIALSGAPVMTVLNLVEELRKKKIVCEKKGYDKGLYFPADMDLTEHLQGLATEKDTSRAIRTLTDYYARTLDEGAEKTLTLAELYLKVGDVEKGLSVVKDGADILLRSGSEEKASEYYACVLEYFRDKEPSGENAAIFLESVLARLSACKELRPYREQMALLQKAERVATRHKKWGLLARIKLEMASELLVAGETERGARNIADFRRLAIKVNDPGMLKKAALSRSELCFWQGKILEATRSYEEVTGDLEEFGDDEITLRLAEMVAYCYVIRGRIARGMGMLNAIHAKARLLGFEGIAYIADLMKVHVFLELRKTSEAEALLHSSTPPRTPRNIYDHLISFVAMTCRAYIHCAKQDYEGAFAWHRKAVEGLPALGWVPRTTPWVLEYLDILGSRGFFWGKMDYQEEIQRWTGGRDIYLKGFALRYRALMNTGKQGPSAEVLADLRKSEKYLKEAGAELELARTRLAIGNYYLKKKDERSARSYLEKAWVFFSNFDKGLFPPDLMAIMPKEEKMNFMISRIEEITKSLGIIRDKGSFLDIAINVAMDFTMAMRGGFFASESNELTLIASRNVDPFFVKNGTFTTITKAVLEAYREGGELIAPLLNVVDETGRKTVTSLIAIPARLGRHVYGYLVLDDRLDGSPFPEDSLPFVRILCGQIAVGLSNINMYSEMKELKDRFEEQASFYKQEMGITSPLEMIIGQSEAIESVTREIRQVARADSSVLILGETGVGKELVAKSIHGLSGRKDGPFIPVNLAAIPQELIASELFGHESGAFTGAKERRKGRFELADGGTIFLDEIGDLPPAVQVNLLRVLQEGTFERLGGSKPITSNFRVVSATNKNLRREVEKGTFRQDLYFRLNVFPIYVPPLRERKDDIPSLTRYFVDKYSRVLGKSIRRIPSEELKKLLDYHWPGNVRELEHFTERAVVLSDGHGINFTGFEYTSKDGTPTEDAGDLCTLADLEREHIVKVLNRTNWRVSGPHGAASILGLKSPTLVFRMKKLGIKRP